MLKFWGKLKNKKGFTLIELVIVVAILGILIAMAAPKLGGITTTAKETRTEANEEMVRKAVAMYYAEENIAGTFTDNTLLIDYLEAWPADITSASVTENGVITVEPAATVATE